MLMMFVVMLVMVAVLVYVCVAQSPLQCFLFKVNLSRVSKVWTKCAYLHCPSEP